MWTVVWFLIGCARVRVTGASPQWALRRLSSHRVPFRVLGQPEELSMELLVPERRLRAAEKAVRGGGFTLQVVEHRGVPAIFGGLLRRPLLLALLLAAAIAAATVPQFVFFYEVSGNERVPDEKILRCLRDLGVGFGTFGPDIHPQELKNHMLLRIPELQWLTVQQSGMCARVVVRERPEKQTVLDRRTPTDVVAARAGVITEVQAKAGNCLCRVGQAVVPGELLISAYTDYGFMTRASAALGEIYADTIRRSVCLVPQTILKTQPTGSTHRAVSLLAGARRIALFGGQSGGTFAHKRTETRLLTLPGGFSLPLGIEITTICEYDTREEFLTGQQAAERCGLLAEETAMHDMIAGTILRRQHSAVLAGNVWRVTSVLACSEMIARMVPAAVRMR